MKRSPIEARFLDQVAVGDGCWLWIGNTNRSGYGRIGLGGRGGRKVLAHRFSYQLFNGEIPVGLHVCHSCDVPNCVNPSHLWLGTDADNARDCGAKGRNPTWRQTACRKGHEYKDGSWTWRTNGDGKRFRLCLVCARPYHAAYMREWNKRQRGAA